MDQLQSACLALAQEALKPPPVFDPAGQALTSKLENVLSALQKLPDLSATAAEYVFFPVRGLLQKDRLGDRVTELVFKVLTALCRTAWNSTNFELERAQQLIAVVSYLLSPAPPMKNEESMSATYFKKPMGYRTAGYECMDAILSASCAAKFGNTLGRSPAIAEVIMLLLACVQFDSDNIDGQLSCFHAIALIFTQIIANRDHRALVLPKVVSKLAKFINLGNKRHFTSKVAAIECLGDVLAAVFDVRDSDSSGSSNDSSSPVMTPEWREKTLENLVVTLEIVQKLQNSLLELSGSRPELVEAIFRFSTKVYSLKLDEKCSQICVQMLLLSSSQSVNTRVSEEARKYLESNAGAVHGDLDRNFVDQLDRIPALLQTPNESSGIVGFEMLRTQVEFFTSANDSSSGERCLLLLEAVERSLPISVTKSSGVRLAQFAQGSNPIKEIELYQQTPNNSNFISLSSLGLNLDMPPATVNALVGMLSSLGTKSAPVLTELIVSRLQEIKSSQQHPTLNSVVLLWLLGGILRGSLTTDVDCYDVVTYCYEDLASSLDLQQAFNNNSGNAGAVSPARAAHTALCCFIIGEAALIEGKQFSDLLMDLVHPLFSMLGNYDSMAIREQAGLAIAKVASACGYKSATELAIANKDYLVDGISFQLNTLNMTPGTFQALASLIYISGADIIPYVDDLFASLFVLLDKYHGYTVLLKGVLTVFAAFQAVIDRTISLPKQIPDEKKDGLRSLDELVEALERKPELDPSVMEKESKITELTDDNEEDKDGDTKMKQPKDSDDEDSDEENMDEPDQAVEKWEYPIPKSTYDIISKIAGYCDRLMTHESAEIRTATLTLVTPLVPYLALNRDLFLPLVHKTWPEATARVFDKEAFVVEHAFACLNAISQYARDFVTARIDQLWPALERKYGGIATKKWPQFAPERRIVNALAGFLQTVVEFVPDVSLSMLESAFITFRPALLRNEYMALRKTISESRRSLGDLLWLVLLEEPQSKSGMPTIEPVYLTA